MACYERENRFHDTNWSKSVLHTRRCVPRASMFMTRLVLIRSQKLIDAMDTGSWGWSLRGEIELERDSGTV